MPLTMPPFVPASVTLALLLLSLGGASVAQDKPPAPDAGQGFVERTFRCADGTDLKYRWLPPRAVDAEQKYPLVVCLHGRGGNTAAPVVLAGKALREKYPCYVM